jgi:hypothetical protein
MTTFSNFLTCHLTGSADVEPASQEESYLKLFDKAPLSRYLHIPRIVVHSGRSKRSCPTACYPLAGHCTLLRFSKGLNILACLSDYLVDLL